MNGQTINAGLAKKRMERLQARLSRNPSHPQKDTILAEIARYKAIVEQTGTEEVSEPDRLLSRVEVLVGSIRKVKALLESERDQERRKRLEKRVGEYQQSLRNIQEFGRETPQKRPVGVKIEVPADVLTAVGGR